MSEIQILAFRIGQSSQELISKEYISFYQDIGRKICSQYLSVSKSSSKHTIPVSNVTINNQPHSIYQILFDALADFGDETSVVILDFNNPQRIVRGTLLIHLASALNQWHRDIGIKRGVSLILLIPDLPPEADDLHIALKRLVEEIRALTIISEKGETWPSNALFNSKGFVVNQLAARGQPLELLEKKLVRTLGHFKRRRSSGSYCVPYFYDGSNCESEIVALFEEFLDSQRINSESAVPIAFHGRISPWLCNAAAAIAERRKLRCIDLSDEADLTELQQLQMSEMVIFIDIVDTSITLSRLLVSLRNRGILNKCRILAVLSTESDDRQERTRILNIDNEAIIIHYLLIVNQVKALHEKCEMCMLELPFDQNDDSSAAIDVDYDISSYHMWVTCQKEGLEVEPDLPRHRNRVLRVPRFTDVIQNNAPWIVGKFKRRLADREGGLPADAVLVCPEENGAEVLANYFKLLLGYSFVLVPRKIIDQFVSSDGMEMLETTVPLENLRWFKELRASNSSEIYILDVFSVTGKTISAVNRIVSCAQKATKACLLYLDLNPAATKTLPCETISLYRFQTKLAVA